MNTSTTYLNTLTGQHVQQAEMPNQKATEPGYGIMWYLPNMDFDSKSLLEQDIHSFKNGE